MGKQVLDIRAGKGITVAQSDEHQRRWSEKGWQRAINKGNYDPTREHLNFEIVKGGKIQAIDKSLSIPEKMAANLAARGIKDPNDRPDLKEPKFRTVVNIILGGSREGMRKLAFGDQEVNWDKGKDNSSIVRKPEIEEWAKDAYKFIADKYGEENIVAFYVHLDETNPHVHCTLLPVADGKLSFKKVMHGESKYAFSENITRLHDEFAEVNRKWNLERGAPVALTGAKHRTTEEYRRWLSGECIDAARTLDSYKEKLNSVWWQVCQNNKKVKALNTMIANLEARQSGLLSQIEIFEHKLESEKGGEEKIRSVLEDLRRELGEVNGKLADKREKLEEAEKQLADARSQLSELDRDRDEMRRSIDSLNNQLWETRNDGAEIAKSFVGAACLEDAVREYSSIRPQLSRFEQPKFDGSVIDDLATKGQDVMICATLLFLGALDEATNFAQSHGGGGGGSDLPWGRDPNEDDRMWALRCARQARKMLKPVQQRIKR